MSRQTHYSFPYKFRQTLIQHYANEVSKLEHSYFFVKFQPYSIINFYAFFRILEYFKNEQSMSKKKHATN